MEYHQENFNGNYDFRCKYHEGWGVENHLHEYSELLYCKKGTCQVKVNGKLITLQEKQLIWLPPNYIHQYMVTDAQLICAVFSNDFLPLFFQTVRNQKLKITPVAAGDMSGILDQFHTLKRENLMVVSGYLHLICAKVLEGAEYDTECKTDSTLYQKVISYISQNFREPISLKSIAKEFGYNEKYLSSLLHGLTGIHFSKLVTLYRVEYAKKLLRDRSVNIAWVAMQSGFSALNSFNRAFKEFTGIPPSQYKKVSRP